MKDELPLSPRSKARSLFLERNGYLRASEAFAYGIHPRDLYALRDEGEIEIITRGLFRLTSLPKLESPGLFTVGVKVPQGVICLQSALEFHKLLPNHQPSISVALVKGSEKPKIPTVPLKYYLISEPAFSAGIETHQKDGVTLRVYGPEKTLADCFKFRNKVGLSLCLEALQAWWISETKKPNDFREFAQLCRVEKVIRPYLELLELRS